MREIYTPPKLLVELERQKTAKLDRVVPSNELAFVGRDKNETVVGDFYEQTLKRGFFLRIKNKDDRLTLMPLNNWAHSQLASKLQIPSRYYNKMRSSGKYKLLAYNCNVWLSQIDKPVLVRTLDGVVRAWLSARYRYIENEEVFLLTLERLKAANAVIHECALTETRMYIKALQRNIKYEVGKHESDPMIPGLIIRNSEVGASRLLIQPFMLRKICRNGLIGEHSFGRIHIGGEQNKGIITWSDKTKELESETIKSKIIDAIDQCFNPDITAEWIDAIKNAQEFHIDDRIAAAEAIRLNLGISEAEKYELVNAFADERPTQWGLVNGITRIAQKSSCYDRQIELEEMGNNILLTPPAKLARWIDKAKEEVKE